MTSRAADSRQVPQIRASSNSNPDPILQKSSPPSGWWNAAPLLLLLLLLLRLPVTPIAAQDPPPPVPFPIGPAPVIHLGETEHDWGTVLQGSLVKHSFEVENHGKAPLRILKVTSTCGCTSTRFDEWIEVGAVGIIELQVDTTDFSGGRPRKNALVQTSDPESPQIQLWMTGLVDPLLHFEKKVLKLAGLSFESKRLTTTILPATELPLEVTGARSKNGSFSVVSIDPLEDGQKGWSLTLEAGPSETMGSLRDDLELSLLLEDQKELKIPLPVVVVHQDRVQMIPNGNVVFYRRHTAPLDGPVRREVKQEVQVRSVRDDLPFETFSAEIIDAPEGLFGLIITEVLPGHHYKLRIDVLKVHPLSQARGTLRIRIGEGEDQVREKAIIAQFRLRKPDSP